MERQRTWGGSSSGRAPALHAGGGGFESCSLHQGTPVATALWGGTRRAPLLWKPCRHGETGRRASLRGSCPSRACGFDSRCRHAGYGTHRLSCRWNANGVSRDGNNQREASRKPEVASEGCPDQGARTWACGETGRRARLRPSCSQERAGSNPAMPTMMLDSTDLRSPYARQSNISSSRERKAFDCHAETHRAIRAAQAR